MLFTVQYTVQFIRLLCTVRKSLSNCPFFVIHRWPIENKGRHMSIVLRCPLHECPVALSSTYLYSLPSFHSLYLLFRLLSSFLSPFFDLMWFPKSEHWAQIEWRTASFRPWCKKFATSVHLGSTNTVLSNFSFKLKAKRVCTITVQVHRSSTVDTRKHGLNMELDL